MLVFWASDAAFMCDPEGHWKGVEIEEFDLNAKRTDGSKPSEWIATATGNLKRQNRASVGLAHQSKVCTLARKCA